MEDSCKLSKSKEVLPPALGELLSWASMAASLVWSIEMPLPVAEVKVSPKLRPVLEFSFNLIMSDGFYSIYACLKEG